MRRNGASSLQSILNPGRFRNAGDEQAARRPDRRLGRRGRTVVVLEVVLLVFETLRAGRV